MRIAQSTRRAVKRHLAGGALRRPNGRVARCYGCGRSMWRARSLRELEGGRYVCERCPVPGAGSEGER